MDGSGRRAVTAPGDTSPDSPSTENKERGRDPNGSSRRTSREAMSTWLDSQEERGRRVPGPEFKEYQFTKLHDSPPDLNPNYLLQDTL